MALSQKHPGLMIVPWFNREEWNHVYQLLRNNTNNNCLKQAQEILQTWKTRTPNLPSGVEGTLMILNILLDDATNTPKFTLRASYGMILVRFLNLCCASGDKQGTFSESVKAHNIPEWIVNTRHDLSHKHNMPSISKLKQALQFCFDWILENYWDKQSETLLSHYSIVCLINKNLYIAIDLYCHINSLYYQQEGAFNLRTLESVDLAVKNKLNSFAKSTNIKLINSISGVLRQLLQFIKDNIGVVQPEQLNLISQEILFGKFFCMKEDDWCTYGNEENELPEDYREAWNALIEMLFDVEFLVFFLKELLEVTNCSLYDASQRRIASLWIFHILQRLLSTQLRENKSSSSQENILKKYPNLTKVSPFRRSKMGNSTFQEIKGLRSATINNPNKYNLTFLSCLLHVCKCPETYITDSVCLMKLICNPEKTSIDFSYKLKTVPKIEEPNVKEKEEAQSEVSNDIVEMEIEESKSYRFKLVQDTSIFKGCPLGVLIFQEREKDPWKNHMFRL